MADIDWTTKAGVPTTMILHDVQILGTHNITAPHPDVLEHLAMGLLTGVHDHDLDYAAVSHAHSTLASSTHSHTHDHEGTYSSAAHTHAYAASTHTHAGGSRLPQSVSIGGYDVLTNLTTNYDGVAQTKGLGMAVVDFTGVANIDFRVFVNKVGNGTQSWQLWNVTDSAEVAVASDTGATGDKTLSVATTVIPSGTKVVRVRAKSSIATDDPVYYGGSILLT